MATRVLDHRSVSYHWRLNAHRGAVNCVWVRVVPETNLQRIYTGGDDGSLRVWDHKGNVVMEMTGHTAPIHALFYANGKIYTGDDEGWICVWNERESRRVLKWRAHEPTDESPRCRITKIQVVSEGRIFTGSWDGTVRLWDPQEESDDIPLQREFPPPAQAHNDPVETFQVVKGNLLFTAHRSGCVRIWNMQEDLLKVIRARGVTARFRCMQVSTTALSDNCTKINIYVGVENRIFLFEIKRRRVVVDGNLDSDNWEFDIDRVRSLEKLSGVTTDVLSIWVVYEDAMQTDEPAMYVGGADGNIYLTIPTDKAVYVDLGSRAMRFKNYTFKGQGGGATCVAVSGGRVFAGNSGGGLTCFKEPYNMEKLRYYSRTVKPYNSMRNLAPIGPRPVRSTVTTTTTTRTISSSGGMPRGGSPSDSYSRTTTTSSSSSGPSSSSGSPYSSSSGASSLAFPDISSLRIKEDPSYPVQQTQPQYLSFTGGAMGGVPGAIPTTNPALASLSMQTNSSPISSLSATPLPLQSFGPSGLQYQQLPNGQIVFASPDPNNPFGSASIPSLSSLSAPSTSTPTPTPTTFDPALFSLSNPALASQFSLPMASFSPSLPTDQSQTPLDPAQQQLLLQQQLLQQQLLQQQLLQQQQAQQQAQQQQQFLTLPDGTQVPIASFQQQPALGLQSLPSGVPVSAASLGLSSLPQTGSMPSAAAPPAAAGGAEKKEPCCVCYDAPRNALIYPCGHACICYNCSRELLKQPKRICPLCRKNIRDIVKIFD